MRLEPLAHTPWWRWLFTLLAALVATLALSGGLLLWAGAPLIDAYQALFNGAFGSRFAISETLTRATPLIFTGLAVAVAFRAKLWNIGAEGQLYLGALAVTAIGGGALLPSSIAEMLPAPLLLALMFVAAILAGGLGLLLPTLLKLHFKVDEVVTTLLLNFIIILFVNYLLFGPWKDPMAMGWPQAAPVIDAGVLPVIVTKTRLHAGLAAALLSALLVWLLLRFTYWGLEIRAVGVNPVAAHFAGVPIHATALRTALLSGGLAACAGVTEVAGTKGYLTLDISPGFGYTGIAVAMLAGLHPLGVVASAVLIAAVYNGADSMSRAVGVSNYLADVMTATALLLVLVANLFSRYRLRRG